MNALPLALIAASGLAAQTPVFKTETRIVEIPVLARDVRNAPVSDLNKRDLRLLDNGDEQRIQTLDKFGAPGQSVTTDPVTDRLGPRFSIIVLDQLNTPFQDQFRSHAAIAEMWRKLPEPHDKLAIYSLGNELRLLCDFTADPDILPTIMGREQPEQLDIGALPLETAELFHDSERRLEITLDAFTRIARRLQSLPGEKSLLWVTAGFVPPNDSHQLYAIIRQLRDAKVRLYPIDARGLIACRILLCPPPVYMPIGMMRELAGQTGGRAYYDTNALAASARAALEDSRQGYLITYTPSHYQRDGTAHTVDLQTSRKGIVLRYRPGYVADLP